MLIVNVPISEIQELLLSNSITSHPSMSAEHQRILWSWLCTVRQALYKAWSELPEGDHLKDALADQVWGWNDEDLYQRRSVETELKEFRKSLEDSIKPDADTQT